MTLTQLRKELGKPRVSLRRLGFKRLGSGAFRTAYGNGKWVIKLDTPYHGNGSMTGLKQGRYNYKKGCSIPLAPTWIVGKWVVQRQYKVIKRASDEYTADLPSVQQRLNRRFMRCFNKGLDVYFYNTGRTKSGKVVAFDW